MKKIVSLLFLVGSTRLTAVDYPALGTGVANPQHATEMNSQPAFLADTPRAASVYGGYQFLLRSAAGSASYHQLQDNNWGWGVTVDTRPQFKSYSASAGAAMKIAGKIRLGGSAGYLTDADGGRIFGGAGAIWRAIESLDLGISAESINNTPWSLRSGATWRYWRFAAGLDFRYLPEEKRSWVEPGLAIRVFTWLDAGGKMRIPISRHLSQVFEISLCFKPLEALQVYLGFQSQYTGFTLAASYFF